MRRYSDDEIRQLVRETYIQQAWAAGNNISRFDDITEAEERWERLPGQQKALLEVIAIGVYRSIWVASMEEQADEPL